MRGGGGIITPWGLELLALISMVVVPGDAYGSIWFGNSVVCWLKIRAERRTVYAAQEACTRTKNRMVHIPPVVLDSTLSSCTLPQGEPTLQLAIMVIRLH